MKPNIDLHKSNKKSFAVILWVIFLIVLIYQIFWLGCEIQKLKQSFKTVDEINSINTRTIQEIQSYLIEEARKNHLRRFI